MLAGFWSDRLCNRTEQKDDGNKESCLWDLWSPWSRLHARMRKSTNSPYFCKCFDKFSSKGTPGYCMRSRLHGMHYTEHSNDLYAAKELRSSYDFRFPVYYLASKHNHAASPHAWCLQGPERLSLQRKELTCPGNASTKRDLKEHSIVCLGRTIPRFARTSPAEALLTLLFSQNSINELPPSGRKCPVITQI